MNQALLTFNAGEVSPYLRHRIDFDKTGSAAETLENFIPMAYGGVIKRPGMAFVAAVEAGAENTRLFPFLASDGRIINLSSAAQAPVDPAAFAGRRQLDHGNAYAQSKLALTMWSNHLAQQLGKDGPAVIAVNPGSFLGTKMVKEAYGRAGNDIEIGSDILTRAATSSEFADASGRYFDNDAGRFASPHPDALDAAKNAALVELIASTTQSISA